MPSSAASQEHHVNGVHTGRRDLYQCKTLFIITANLEGFEESMRFENRNTGSVFHVYVKLCILDTRCMALLAVFVQAHAVITRILQCL